MNPYEKSKKAFINVIQKIQKSNKISINSKKIFILYGPNTDHFFNKAKVKDYIARLCKVYKSFQIPKRFHLIVYSDKDVDWAHSQTTKLGWSIVPTTDGGAHGGTYDRKNFYAALIINLKPEYESDLYFKNGGIINHEFGHALQECQFIGSPSESISWWTNIVPGFFIEGQTHFIAFASLCNNYKDYITIRNQQVIGHNHDLNQKLWDLSKDGLRKYFTDYTHCFDHNYSSYNFGYSWGLLATEYLCSQYGIDSVIQLFVNIGKSKDTSIQNFLSAFQKTFQKEWDTLLDEIIDYIYAECMKIPNIQ
jgi:hypothetical protein